MGIPSLPQDMVTDGWREVPDPDIAGSLVWVHAIPRTNDLVLVALLEEGRDKVSVLRMPADLEHTLAHGIEGECVYEASRTADGGRPLWDAVEYAGSLL